MMKEQERCPLGVKFIRTGASIALAAAMLPTAAVASENDLANMIDQAGSAIQLNGDSINQDEYYDDASLFEIANEQTQGLSAVANPDSITPLTADQINTFTVDDYTEPGYSFTLSEDSIINLSITVVGKSKRSGGLGIVNLIDSEGTVWDSYVVSKNGVDESGSFILPKGTYTLSYNAIGTSQLGYRILAISYKTSTETGAGPLSDFQYATSPNRSYEESAPANLNNFILGHIYWAGGYTLNSSYVDAHYYSFTIDKATAPTVLFFCKGLVQVAIVDSNDNVVVNGSNKLQGWINNNDGGSTQFNCGELNPGTYTVRVLTGDENSWGVPFLGLIQEFYDVDYTKWYAPGISFCSDKGLLSGYTNGNGKLTGQFGTGDTLTRAQLAAILWRNAEPKAAAAYNADQDNTTGMADVENRAWYTGAANWAVKNGIINGFDGKEFRPNDPVTTEQFVTILANYVNPQGAEQADQSSLNSFADAGSISSWARGSVAWAKKCEIINGYEEDEQRVLKPSENVARERAATILMNSFDSGVLA